MDEEKLEREAAKILFSTPSKPEEEIPSKEAARPGDSVYLPLLQ